MSTYRMASITLAAVTITVTACAQQLGGQPSTEPSPDATRSSFTVPSVHAVPRGSGGNVTGEVPEDVLADILAAAAAEAGVDPSMIEVVVAEEVTWSDGSLGCPEPGMSYTQAMVPGYRVVVDADGEELNFHASQSGGFQICDNPQLPSGSDR